MKKLGLLVAFTFFYILFASFSPLFAQGTPTHFTIILSQVRGPECCDRGSIRWFKEQQATLKDLGLTGNFALRYDALQNDDYLAAAKADSHNQYGALFEITPELAKAAEVTYKSDPSRWYEAQNVYLIGYTQAERKKLIDTYMQTFADRFGGKPQFSSAWMIDAWSLAYLRKNYGILAHQITREQFGTDSYTLYGGPAHYPYYPSSNWALIPQPNNQAMPLIIRQTIMDPVYVYGDLTSSYTSQPNDYYLRKDTTKYFLHLFNQAHTQPHAYTFALIGLENTMPEEVQMEFATQLREVKNWQTSSPTNTTISVADFANWYNQHQTNITSYSGTAATDDTEQAWWVNTPRYRARVRWSEGTVALTDLRLYDPQFTDPYFTDTAKSLGWLVVPFALDGSRYFAGSTDGATLKNDYLKNRPSEVGEPLSVVLATNVTQAQLQSTGTEKVLTANGHKLVTFTADTIELSTPPNLNTLADLPDPLHQLSWQTADQPAAWGFHITGSTLTPFVNYTDLATLRTSFRSFLFPEKQFEPLDDAKTFLHVNNKYAMAGRNPIRLILFPKNSSGEAILIPSNPTVTTTRPVDEIAMQMQHQSDGSVLIELKNSQPMTTKVTITADGFTKTVNVYFAPNCKEQKLYCITHPRQAWWFIRNYWADQSRARQAAKQKTEFVDQL